MAYRTLRVLPDIALEAVRILWWTAIYAIRYPVVAARGGDKWVHRATVLRGYLLKMGPLYIKAGQILGTQSGVLPPRATDEFRRFFSDLPPMRAKALNRILRRSNVRFERFDRNPIAVGSVAQIHRAVLPGGDVAAVKVVKAGVRERLVAASRVLGAVLAVGHVLVPALRRYDLRGHFAALRPLLTGQCDMRVEAARQDEIALNFRHHPFVRVPRTYDALCGTDMLVMEFVDAVRGQEVGQAGLPRSDLAARLLDVFNTMVYFHGVFHVDPHPGNIMFGRDKAVILLDFGLVGRLSEDDKWNLSSFYYACVRNQWELAVQRFTRTFALHPERVGEGVEPQLQTILRHHFEQVSSRWSTMSFLDDASRVLHRCGTMVSTRFSLLALSVVTGEGFLSQVDPEMDIWRNGRRFTDRFSPYLSDELRETFRRELGPVMPGSVKARREAAGYLVAPTHFDRFVLPSAFPLVVEQAYGSKVCDVDRRQYIDLSGGYGPHILGYAHPVAVRAIQNAAAAGGVNAVGSPSELRLARLITGAFGPDAMVVLANSGTEAVQVAVRMARAHTGRQRVAKFEGHYHGFSDQGMVSSWFRYRGDASFPEPVANSAGAQREVVDGTLVLQYGDRVSLERVAVHASSLACVLVEPMQSVTAGYDEGFLRELSAVCAEHGVLLVYDEVVTGFRVGYGGVQHLVGVRPDLTCLGKIIGGGLPCGAVVGRPEVVQVARTSGDPFLDVERRAFVGGTMSGNSITAAAGAAVLTHLRDNPGIYDELHQKTVWLTQELRALSAEQGLPCEVRGQRSVFTISFDYARPVLVRDRLAGSHTKANIALACYMRKYGVHMPELHTLMLSDAHTDADLKQVSEAFASSLREMTTAGFFTA